MIDSILHIGGFRFSYPDRPPCLRLPELNLQRGKICVITGDNGSGKTTLLKILGGLLDPVDGVDRVDGLRELRRDAVYLHQNPYLFRGTVARNLALADRRSSHTDINRTLGIVGLQGFADRQVRSLSGGEARRVALARVFHSDQKVILLDEPAAHVDAASMAQIESACLGFAREGRTVVIASHKDGFGYRVADYMINLSEGLPEPGTMNILRGSVRRYEESQLIFGCGNIEFGAPLRDGPYTVAVIPGEDILVSRGPLESSARNCLKGEIRSLIPSINGTVLAGMDCGMELRAVVTGSAVSELGLIPGTPVYATFKASSVALY